MYLTSKQKGRIFFIVLKYYFELPTKKTVKCLQKKILTLPLIKKSFLILHSYYKRKNQTHISSGPAMIEKNDSSKAKSCMEKHLIQEIDTNVLRINLNVLKNMGSIISGDPVFCSQCKAIMNMESEIKVTPEKRQIWICEFCNNTNPILIDEEEKVDKDDATFVLESAAQSMLKKGGGDSISIIFCIDISGSMCVSQRVRKKFDVKYDQAKKIQNLMEFSDGSYQLLKGETAEQTYISRMQCVQIAIEKQLKELVQGAPERKVGLVTFNNDVTLIGDGTVPSKVITGDKLNHKKVTILEHPSLFQ